MEAQCTERIRYEITGMEILRAEIDIVEIMRKAQK
jgi:hypothetical protein